MTVRFRKERNKWLASICTTTGRISRSFETEAEARHWERIQLATVEQQRHVEAHRAGTLAEGTLSHLVAICGRIDWEGKDPAQMENAVRAVNWIGPDTHAAELTMQRLDQVVLQLRQRGCSNTTIQKYLSALSVLLKRACRLGYISAMPLFPEARTLRRPEPRDLVIRDEWLDALLQELDQRERRVPYHLTRFLRLVGCRVGEALDLTWDRVDFNARTIQFVRTKGNMPRRLPMAADVEQILQGMRSWGSDHVFPCSYSHYVEIYREAKHAACDRLGLGPHVRQEWVIHTLRHTRITELAQQGWQAPAIQQWAGHRSLTVTQRYIHAAGINLSELVHG